MSIKTLFNPIPRCRALACFALLIASASGYASPGISDNTVRIGLISDMSGPFSALEGPTAIAAAQMAINDFKKNNDPVFQITLTTADHSNRPDNGAAKVREWYDSGVDLVIGGINSGVALAISEVARSKQKLFIVTGSGTMRLTNEACSPYTINYVWDTYSTSRPHTKYAVDHGANKWFFITVDYALGASIDAVVQPAIKALGATVVGEAKNPLGTTDFSSFLLQAQTAKANALALANAGADLQNAIKGAKEFKLTDTMQIVPLAMSTVDVRGLGLDIAKGIVFTEAYFPRLNAKTRELSTRFENLNHTQLSAIPAGVYSAIYNYLTLVKEYKSDDAMTIRRAFSKLHINDGFATNGTVRADGSMTHDMYVVQVKQPTESTGLDDVLNLLQVMPGSEAYQPLSQGHCKDPLK